jgi:hypothetical protein
VLFCIVHMSSLLIFFCSLKLLEQGPLGEPTNMEYYLGTRPVSY